MIEKVLVPLLIVGQMGTLAGKTRLQKLVCLLEASLRERNAKLGYAFQIYHHGPFSFELANLTSQLVQAGLLVEKPQVTPTGNTLFSYWLSPDGAKLIDETLEKDPGQQQLVSDVAAVVKQFGYLPLEELVEKAYGAFPRIQASL